MSRAGRDAALATAALHYWNALRMHGTAIGRRLR
jgi:hypothetical protein